MDFYALSCTAREIKRANVLRHCMDRNSSSVKNSEKNHTYVFFDAGLDLDHLCYLKSFQREKCVY